MWRGLGSVSVSKSIQGKYYFIPLLLLVKAQENGKGVTITHQMWKKIKTQMKNTKKCGGQEPLETGRTS